MAAPNRTVHVREQDLGSRVVLAVTPDDRRTFEFGERVYVLDDEGDERIGIVSWDPVARWVVSIEERDARIVPW